MHYYILKNSSIAKFLLVCSIEPKKRDVYEFMSPFVNYILNILNEGLIVNNILFILEMSNIVCDSSAKAVKLDGKNLFMTSYSIP